MDLVKAENAEKAAQAKAEAEQAGKDLEKQKAIETAAKAEKYRLENLSGEQWTAEMPQKIIQNGGYTNVQLRNLHMMNLNEESSSTTSSGSD